MEKWIKEAKERIKSEADLEMFSCERIARENDLDEEWVLEEFIKEFLKIKQLKKDGRWEQ